MNLKDIKVEKIALFLLTAFILILFLDYSFDIRIILSKKLNYEIKDISRLRYLKIISIIPILYFIEKKEYDKKSNTLINSILPFMAFLIGFYLLKIDFFKSVDGIVILMFIQLMSSLTILTIINSLLGKVLKWFFNKNEQIIELDDKEHTIKTLETCLVLKKSVLKRYK